MNPWRAINKSILLCCWLAFAISTRAGWLEQPINPLHLQSTNGFFRSDISGTLDLEGYYADQRPPGILFGNDPFFNPRLSLFLDVHLGNHIYIGVQGRADRGFDPKSMPNGDARADEYFLRYTPFDDARLNLEAGKFAMVFGNWVNRHDSWNNPLINAPLAYENITTISDGAAPASPAAFLARRGIPDKKANWLPIIWGPSYTSGGTAFGSVQRFDYALEIKNASISSRPAVWDATQLGWANPTVTGRLGFRPDESWNLGVSASGGAYLLPSAASTLPAGKNIGDYRQYTIGQDASYAWHHWQFWEEIIASRFEVPNVGNADTLAYYLEAKYKITTHLFASARWNQQFFGTVNDGAGHQVAWDNDAWRTDAALGWRWNQHLQTKIQYSYNHQRGALQQGEQLVAAQITAKF
ncbi:MAG TPA: hypothetical protein VE344_08135 [Methylomirabilota bacterium]|nr:hypothetical protein [Methylomirabilota bacterium]